MGENRAQPMVGGEGQYSYYNNSTYQKSRFLEIKDLVYETIVDKFDVPIHARTIRIADLGCSVGPNTFFNMQAIADAIQVKLKTFSCDEEDEVEMQIFFNDQFGNDFNLLLTSIPSDRSYLAAAVPGSFHSRLFPRASIHCFNSSLALHWLSKAPTGAANRGRIHCYGGGADVLNAYIKQFRTDATAFLSAREKEMVTGGLLILQFLCRPEWMAPDAARYDLWLGYLELILRQFVSEGKVKEEELDSYQLPLFAPSIDEFKELVEMNGRFTIHVAEHVNQGWGLNGGGDEGTKIDVAQLAQSVGVASRAIFEGMVSDHFGSDIMEELFHRFPREMYQHFTSVSDSLHSPPPTALYILQKKHHSSA